MVQIENISPLSNVSPLSEDNPLCRENGSKDDEIWYFFLDSDSKKLILKIKALSLI